MAVYELPLVPSVAYYDFYVTLSEREYNVLVQWNDRDDSWYMSVSDASGDLIVAGARIVLGRMIAFTADPRGPFGSFIAIDTSGSGQEAGYDDLGTRVSVLYVET